MTNSKKRLLIISYTFPPNEGIGGRRWAKFGKHLVKKGFDLHVVHQASKQNERSTWHTDVSHPNITTHPISPFYPKSFSFSGSSSLLSKIAFQLWKYILSAFYRGVIFDRALFWEKTVQNQIKSILSNNNISHVIVTIPPFLLASYVLKLKKGFPNVKFVIDYRDPWTDNKSFHGFSDLKEKRLEFEKKIERQALLEADLILSTTKQMNFWNQSKIEDKSKFKVLENGYDKDEVQVNKLAKKGNKPITFLLAGSIYSGLEYIIDPFVEVVYSKEKTDPQFSKNFEFVFIGSASDKLNRQVSEKKINSIKVLPRVSRLELNTFYNQADIFMMFSAIDHGFAFNTKFYEYLAYKKPIIQFGPEGDVSNFLIANKVGVGVSSKNFKEEFANILNDIKGDKLKFNEEFKIEQFEIESLTNKLISYLEN